VDIDLLRQRVKVRMEDEPETIGTFANADIAILRSGKAKKNDPPIPDDLAPISGAGKRMKKKEEKEGEKPFLDPIRFRYSEETVVEESALTEEETVAEPKENKRRRRNKSKAQNQPEQSETPKAEKKAEQPKPEKKKEKKQPEAPKEQAEPAAGEDAAKKPRRRHHRRYHKPKQGGEN
jgi:hypothetical protein